MILVTGFKARADSSNASNNLIEAFIDDFPDELNGLSIAFELLEDDGNALQDNLFCLLEKTQPTLCVFSGQAPGRNKITIERIATNYRFLGPPKAIGKPPQGEIIDHASPAAYLSTLPQIEDAIDKLHDLGIPSGISNDAGNSLCNQILYEGLRYAERRNRNMRCGFVHIPALPEQVIKQWPQYAFMPLEMSMKAVISIVLHAAQGIQEKDLKD